MVTYYTTALVSMDQYVLNVCNLYVYTGQAASIIPLYLSQTFSNVFNFLDPCFLRVKVAVLYPHIFIEADKHII